MSPPPGDPANAHATEHTATLAVDDLLEFLRVATSPFHAAELAAQRLVRVGMTDASGEPGSPLPRLGVLRRSGQLWAWIQVPGAHTTRMIAAHTDSPNLRIRPIPDRRAVGTSQLLVEVYGGALLNSWLDRDLALSGRIAIRSGAPAPDGTRAPTTTRLVQWADPVARVPQLAIHLDRAVNERLTLSPQSHLHPIWQLGESAGDLRAWLAKRCDVDPVDILAWDLMFHDADPPTVIGADRSMISAGRLDNLVSCWAGVVAMEAAVRRVRSGVDGLSDTIVLALFDHEEVGSTSATGAAAGGIGRLVERLAEGAPQRVLAASADMAHATHPNYPERHDPNHFVRLGGGPTIKVNASQRYATDAVTAAGALDAAERAGVDVQWYSHHGDSPCGSTIGPTLAAQLGADTVDVGAPMLSMHSARELMATADVVPYASLLREWLTGEPAS